MLIFSILFIGCALLLMMMLLLSSADIFLTLLYLNTTTSIATLLICVFSIVDANLFYLDIALIYFLLSIVANSAYLKYFIKKNEL